MRALREQQNLTLEKLAELSGVDLGTISALEVRDSTRSKYALQIAEGLGVSLEELLGGESRPNKQHEHRTEEWPFRTPYSDYAGLSPEKKRQLDERVAEFIAGALPSSRKTATQAKAS